MSKSEFFCLNHIKTKNMGAGYLIKYNIYPMDLTGNVLHHVKNPKKSWLQTYARIGLAAKGVVHCLVGGLALMAAFGMGGQQGDSQDALRFLYDKPLGVIMLIILAIGLVGYAVWRFIQAIKDPDQNGTDKKGLVTRIGFGFSGIVYVGFSFFIVKMLLNGGNSGGGGGGQQEAIAEVLSKPFGQIVIFIVGAIVIIRGLYHVYRGWSGKFKKHIYDGGMNQKARQFFDRAGKLGYSARGIVWALIGFFIIQAALKADPSEAEGTSGVFEFLESTGGSILLGVIALSFFCYGLFMFVKAKYRVVKI